MGAPDVERPPDLLRPAGRPDHGRAGGDRELHDRGRHARPCGVHEHDLARLHPTDREQGVPRRHVGDRQAGRLDERDRLGDRVAPRGRCRPRTRRSRRGGSNRRCAGSRSTARARRCTVHTRRTCSPDRPAPDRRSPAIRCRRPEPRATTTPATSIPATCGSEKPRTSGATRCSRSSRLSPQARTAITTSSGPGTGSARSSTATTSGPPKPRWTCALTWCRLGRRTCREVSDPTRQVRPAR